MSTGGKRNPGRSACDEVLALGLARGLTLAEAATAAGVSERTASRRIAEPEFIARVGQMRSRLIETALGQLADGMAEAAQTLRALLKASNEAIRLGAAKSLLELTIKIQAATEYESRLQSVESRLAKQENGGRKGRAIA